MCLFWTWLDGVAGARGGKRSVTHLSKAQLARKRANDREAQRNIRQRTKEHIENLERKVKELEGGGRSSSVERIIQRNAELEEEVEKLRAQIAQSQVVQQTATSLPQAAPHIPEEQLIAQKVTLEWLPKPEQPLQWSTGAMESHNPSIPSNDAADAPYTLGDQIYPPREPEGYDEQDDSQQQQYAQTAIHVWNDPMALDDGTQSFAKPDSEWAHFHPALSQPSRFADPQASGFSEVCSSSKQVILTTTR